MKILIAFLSILISPYVLSAQKITDQEILDLFDGLRVADVSDGMDMVGLPDVGIMDQRIQPLSLCTG